MQNGETLLTGRASGRYHMTTFSILPDEGGIENTMSYKGVMSVLKINQVVKSDEGSYGCGMTNPYGSDVAQIQLVVRGNIGWLLKHLLSTITS